MKRNCFIAISGNIGVGKTTWTKFLVDRFKLKAYYEKVIENPYLHDFYKDMEKWSFHSQIFFLTQRFKTHLEIQRNNIACIQDRTIYEDSEIFAENLYQRGFMSKRDFECYRDIYEAMLNILRYPDLLIYLRASIGVLLERVRRRSRDCEKNIDKEYLMQLNMSYDRWIQKMQQLIQVVVIDTDELDIFRENVKLQEVIRSIDGCLLSQA